MRIDGAAGPAGRRRGAVSVSPSAAATRLVLISGSGILAANILLPCIPLIARDMHLPVAELSLAAASFSGGYAAAHLLYGSIPERVSTNRILAVSLVVLLLATLAALAPHTLPSFLITVAAMGAGAAAAPALLPSLIADAYQDCNSSDTMSMLAAIEGVLPPLAATFGTVIALGYGWKASFVAIAVATVVSAISLRSVRRGRSAAATAPSLSTLARYSYLFRDPDVFVYTVAAAAPFAALVVFMNLSPAILSGYYGVGPIAFGIMQIFTVATFILGSITSTRISSRRSLLWIDAAGLGLTMLTGVAFVAIALSASTSPALYILAVLPSQFGFGLRLGPMLNQAIATSTFARITSVSFGFITFALASVVTFAIARITSPVAAAIGFTVFSSIGLVGHCILRSRRIAVQS